MALLTRPGATGHTAGGPRTRRRTRSKKSCATGARLTSLRAGPPPRTWRSPGRWCAREDEVAFGLASANHDPRRFSESGYVRYHPARRQPAHRLRQGDSRMPGGAARPHRRAWCPGDDGLPLSRPAAEYLSGRYRRCGRTLPGLPRDSASCSGTAPPPSVSTPKSRDLSLPRATLRSRSNLRLALADARRSCASGGPRSSAGFLHGEPDLRYPR